MPRYATFPTREQEILIQHPADQDKITAFPRVISLAADENHSAAMGNTRLTAALMTSAEMVILRKALSLTCDAQMQFSP